MYLLTFIGGAMIGGIVTLFLHCCLIVGRERVIDNGRKSRLRRTKRSKKGKV